MSLTMNTNYISSIGITKIYNAVCLFVQQVWIYLRVIVRSMTWVKKLPYRMKMYKEFYFSTWLILIFELQSYKLSLTNF